MAPSLNHIRSVVTDELGVFDERFRTAMKSRVSLLYSQNQGEAIPTIDHCIMCETLWSCKREIL